jgi:hypothetical protein
MLPYAYRGQNPQFITSVVTALQLEYYAPGDIVVRQGDMGDAMYFLGQGSLEVGPPIGWSAERQRPREMQPGWLHQMQSVSAFPDPCQGN